MLNKYTNIRMNTLQMAKNTQMNRLKSVNLQKSL